MPGTPTAADEAARRRLGPPTPRSAAYYLTRRMGPHKSHQAAWQRNDDGTIDCGHCHTKIIGPDDITRSGTPWLTSHEQGEVREAVSRWLRHHAETAARIIIPVHKPG
jgi:hypothetical protein